MADLPSTTSDADPSTPFFIVGVPRSGTTLLSSFLSAHPRLTVSPESQFLSVWMPRFRHLDLTLPEHFDLFWTRFSTSERFSYFGVPAHEVLARIPAGQATFRDVFAALLDSYARRQAKPRWGEKTPAHYEHVATLLGWFPSAKVLFVVRDPRSVTASLLRVPWSTGGIAHHARRWQHAADLADAWSGDRRVQLVMFEDLVRDPQGTVAGVLRFLGEEPVAEDAPRESSHLLEGRSGWARDHVARTQEPVSPARAESWRSELTTHQVRVVEALCRGGMERFGYVASSEPATTREIAAAQARSAAARLVRLPQSLGDRAKRAADRPVVARAQRFAGALPRRTAKAARLASRTVAGSRHARRLPRSTDLLHATPVLGYIGWLHHANVGDEAVYEAIERLFDGRALVSYNDVLPVELQLYRLLVKRPLFDGVILGGGTLINDRGYLPSVRAAVRRGRPLFVFGTGVREPDFWRPGLAPSGAAGHMGAWSEVLRDAARVAVRGPRSRAILEDHGLTGVDVIGDPALILGEVAPRVPADGSGESTVAINLGSTGPMWGTRGAVTEAVAGLVHELERRHRLEFVAMHPADLEAAATLFRALGHELPMRRLFRRPAGAAAALAGYHAVIAERLHGVVLAHAFGVPAVALAYRPKVLDHMACMRQDDVTVRTDQVSAKVLLETWERLTADRSGRIAALVGVADALRRRQRQAASDVLRSLDLPPAR